MVKWPTASLRITLLLSIFLQISLLPLGSLPKSKENTLIAIRLITTRYHFIGWTEQGENLEFLLQKSAGFSTAVQQRHWTGAGLGTTQVLSQVIQFKGSWPRGSQAVHYKLNKLISTFTFCSILVFLGSMGMREETDENLGPGRRVGHSLLCLYPRHKVVFPGCPSVLQNVQEAS